MMLGGKRRGKRKKERLGWYPGNKSDLRSFAPKIAKKISSKIKVL